MTSIRMGFGQAEAILAEVNFIASDKRSAFQARLKNFQRLGLLQDLPQTRGNVSRYEGHHLLQMALAVELAQLGVSPERSIKILGENKGNIIAAVRHNVLNTKEAPKSWSPMVLFFDPHGLVGLSRSPDPEREDFHTQWFATLDELKDLLRQWSKTESTRMSIINISGLIVSLANEMGRVFGGDAELISMLFGQSLLDWAKAVGPDYPPRNTLPPPASARKRSSRR